MKKLVKKFISLFMALTLVLSVNVMDTKHVHAEETLSATLLTENVKTTSYNFFRVVEFTAPYDETYTFLVSDANWDSYGLVFDSSADVDQIIENAYAKIENGETQASKLIPEGYIIYEDDEAGYGDDPSIDVELTKGETYTFVLCGYDTSCYGNATVTVSLTHGAPEIKGRTIESCESGGYTGDVYCAECDRVLEEGKEIPAGQHEEGVIDKDTAVKATCTEDGYIGDIICPVCETKLADGETETAHHTPTEELVNIYDANCYAEGNTGDIACEECGEVLTPGTSTPKTTHEYVENVCKHCDRIQNAELDKEYTLDVTISQLCQVVEFTAPYTGKFEFYCDSVYDEDGNYEYWDGYGYLLDGNTDIDKKITTAIKDVRNGNEDCLYLSGFIDEADEGQNGLPILVEELTKDKKYYFVLSGYEWDDFGTAILTIRCAHGNTEVRNKAITSCAEGGYSGDIYCKDCDYLIEAGQKIEAGSEHNYTSELISEAVCNSYAQYEYTCTYCGDSYTEYDEDNGYGSHSYKTTGYVKATCTTDGHTGKRACEHCGDVRYEDSVIKAYHNDVDESGYNPNYSYYENRKAETCMMDGYTGDLECLHCGEVFEKGMTISATGHNFTDGICKKCGIEENLLPISADGYYEIDSADDLVLFMMNAHRSIKGKITKDIVTPDDYEYEDMSTCAAANSLLDGGNHKISNWNLNGTYFLFSTVDDSTIKNLTVEVNVPEDTEITTIMGVIAKNAVTSAFENITINGKIYNNYARSYLAGLVGYAERCTFNNCTNNADITVAGGNTGGIAGDGNYSVFTNCVNNGDISATEDEVGGIVGEIDDGTFINCVNNGKISTEDEQAGGIVGNVYVATFTNCKNYGDIICVSDEESADEIGGIVGSTYYYVTIIGCENYGTIGNKDTDLDIDEVGGIVGQIWDSGKITNCTNYGAVYAGGFGAGGICGDYEYDVDTDILEISNCVNNGSVYAGECAGGILGEGYKIKVNNCVNNGYISGKYSLAAIIGYAEDATIDKVYNTGMVDGTDEETTVTLVHGEDGVTISNSEANHTHKYEQKVLKPATATTDGEAELVCMCGASNGKVVLKKTGSEDTTTKNQNTEEPTTKVTNPAKTKIKQIKNIKKKKIKLTWKKISGATGYQVRYATNKKFKKATIKTIKKNKTKFTIKKLKKKKYYVQVRAYKVVDGKTYVGKWSKRKSVKVKK